MVEVYISNTIPKHSNSDDTVDTFGRKLLKLCSSTGLLIFNGRHSNDPMMSLPFVVKMYRVQLTKLNNLDNISQFEVLLFNEHSDHTPVHFCLKSLFNPNNGETNESTKPTQPLVKIEQSDFQRLRALSEDDKPRLNQLCLLVDNPDIDHVVQEFTCCLNENVIKVFKSNDSNKLVNRQCKQNKQRWV